MLPFREFYFAEAPVVKRFKPVAEFAYFWQRRCKKELARFSARWYDRAISPEGRASVPGLSMPEPGEHFKMWISRRLAALRQSLKRWLKAGLLRLRASALRLWIIGIFLRATAPLTLYLASTSEVINGCGKPGGFITRCTDSFLS
jgi:hypothetical protein